MILSNGCSRFIEVGPGTDLLGMGQNAFEDLNGPKWYPSVCQDRSDRDQLFETLAALFVDGAQIKWKEVNQAP